MSVGILRRAILVGNRKLLKKSIFSRTLTSGTGEKNILHSELSDVDIPNVTIHEFVYNKIAKFAKYTGTVCSVTERSYTYDEIRIKSRNLSKALRTKLKLKKGDVVGILVANCPEFPIACLGILEAGLIVSTLNPLYTPDEISRQLADSSAKALITLHELCDNAQKANAKLKSQIPIMVIKTLADQSIPQGYINFEEFVNVKIDIPDYEPGDPKDLAVLPYSSGTTGLPKGVRLSHYNVVSNLSQLFHPGIQKSIEATDSHQDVVPVVLPMFHIYGFTVNTFYIMGFGSKLVTLPKFTPDLYISVLDKNDVNVIFAAPPLILFFALHPNVKVQHFAKVRNVMSGAAPLGTLDEQRFTEKFGNDIELTQGYGLTETAPVVSLIYKKMLTECKNVGGSIGKPLSNTELKIIKIDDPTGTPLGPNENGELLVKGPQVMESYHNRPEETKSSFLDGWFRTGDLMHYNDEGVLFVTDRLKELIKVKGFQVPPAELEEVIRSFPTVVDAAVIGIPHPIYGEVPRAYIVPKANNTLKADDLSAYVNEKVAPYKQLKGGIEIVDGIPKNAAGKILRRQLKLKYEAENK